MLIKREITNSKSFQYLRKQLASEKTLSNFLSQEDIEAGKVYTFIPEDMSENRIYNFGRGGLYPSEKKRINGARLSKIINKAKPLVNDLIQNYLNASPKNCCIFEECNSIPTDPWVINSRIEYEHIKDEMYYFVDKKNNTNERLEQAFLHSGGWYFLCVLSSLDLQEHDNFSPWNEISPTLMNTIADNATAFFVDAYDHESYLMWER